MTKLKVFLTLTLVIFSSMLLSACTKKAPTTNQSQEELADDITPYTDKLSSEKINITRTIKPNEEFKVKYKTFSPDGEGEADFRVKPFKLVEDVDGVKADEGKKLVLVEIGVKGNVKNKGLPSTFNQIGDHPSPQFVMIDTDQNQSFVEETYFSDIYTVSKKLFELSKITMDGDNWVNTAIVFQIDKNLSPNLAFRFTNIEGKTEFYDVQE